MTGSPFSVLDDTRFPIVALDSRWAGPGGADGVIADLEFLLVDGRSFVLCISDGPGASGTSGDDRQRLLQWLQRNRPRLIACCRGIVVVLGGGPDLAFRKMKMAGLQVLLGLPVRTTTDPVEADAMAARLIDQAS